MPTPELDVNHGLVVTFAACTILAARKILDVTLPGGEIETFNASHQGTVTGAMAKIPADIHENSPLEYVVQHLQDVDILSELGNTGPVTVKPPAGGTALISFDGIFKSYKPQNTPWNEPMYADVVIEVNGDVTYAAGP